MSGGVASFARKTFFATRVFVAHLDIIKYQIGRTRYRHSHDFFGTGY